MTLKDIADKAGVSMMTVSNVINGKHNRVSTKTIEKVNAIIKEYNYVPNMNARTLTNKTSNIIAAVISSHNDTFTSHVFEDPYVSTMIGIIERELIAMGTTPCYVLSETLMNWINCLRTGILMESSFCILTSKVY